MNYLIMSFFCSFIVTLGLIRYQNLHTRFSGDQNLSGPQKFHTNIVPRIGGISIFLSILITGLISLLPQKPGQEILLAQILACSLPTFLIGLLEDLTKIIGVKTRLLATASSAGFLGYYLNAWIISINVPGLDWMLNIWGFSVIFTIVSITGLANAYNIIDGFNGLASMIAIISLLAIGYVAFKVNDSHLTSASLIVIGAIAGFFIWNYPRGLIFLGDGGAYLIGFFIAGFSILLVLRNPNVSPWFVLLVNAYPIFETLFTIWRRKVYQGKNPSLPDGAHFHSLIYRRLIRWTEIDENNKTAIHSKNAKTSPYLWLLSSLAVFPAIIWWHSTWILQCFALLFCLSYIILYKAIVKFKTPIFLKLRK